MPGLIQTWDVSILSWLRACHDPMAIWAAWLVAILAWKGIFFWVLTAILWIRGHRLLAAQMALALVIGTVEIGSLKELILRPRPDLYTSQQLNIPMPELLSTTHSFPSGHTMLAAAAAAVLIAHFKGWRAWASVLFVILVGIARVFQGMHWPSDVVGSIILGAVAGVVGVKLCEIAPIKKMLLRPGMKATDDKPARVKVKAGLK